MRLLCNRNNILRCMRKRGRKLKFGGTIQISRQMFGGLDEMIEISRGCLEVFLSPYGSLVNLCELSWPHMQEMRVAVH